MSKLEAIERKYEELTNQIHNLIEEENRLIGGCIQNGTPDAWKDESLEVGKNVALTNKAIKKIEAEIALIEPEYVKLLENA